MSFIHFLTHKRRCMVFNIEDYQLPKGAEVINTGDWVPALILARLQPDVQVIVNFYNWGQVKYFNPDSLEDQVYWADASGITHIKVRSPRHSGWSSPLEALGLNVVNSAKLAKRCKEIVRIARYFRAAPVNIWWYDPSLVSAINYEGDMAYDGMNVITRSFANKMGVPRNVKRGNIRILGPEGLIKGDAIIVPDNHVPSGFDVIAPNVNLKSELSTNGWTFTTFNPHHAHNQAMFDVQSAAWLREWLFPREELKNTLTNVIDNALESLNNGEWPKWMILPEDVAHIDNLIPEDEQASEAFNRHYLRWQLFGRKPEESAAIMGMAANAFKARMQSKLDYRDPQGKWKPKMWIPLAWAVYGHIITHESLEMAGYSIPEGCEDKLFYHADSHSFSLPTAQFIDTFDAHGGWDLDDSAKFFLREDEESGKVVAIIVRSPNSDGEYSIHEVGNIEDFPLYHQYGEMPKVDLTTAPARIEMVRAGQSVAGMPKNNRVVDPVFTKDEADHMVAIQAENPGVGRIANAFMVYYDALKTSPTHILAGMEDIVDCVQQTPYIEGFAGISQFTADLWAEIKEYGKVDKYLLRTRTPNSIAEDLSSYEGYFSQLFDHFSKEVRRFSDVSRTIGFRLRSQNLIEEVMDMQIEFGPAIKWVETAERRFTENSKKFFGHTVAGKRARTEANRQIIRDMVAKLNTMTEDKANHLVLAMYRYCVTPGSTGATRYGRSDRCLFAPLLEGEDTVMDIFIRALRAIGAKPTFEISE